MKDTYLIGVLVEDHMTLSVTEICDKYRIPQELLQEMLEQGLFSSQGEVETEMKFDQKAIRRLTVACRLHYDLGVNLPGAALALDLLEELDDLRHELAILRKHV